MSHVSLIPGHLANYRPDSALAAWHLLWPLSAAFVSAALHMFGILPWWLYFVYDSLLTLKLFIIFHDLGHGSFFEQKRLNKVAEWIVSFFVITPVDWTYNHHRHHQLSGNLKDPDMWSDTIFWTVRQYKGSPMLHRWGYRLFRDPFVFFTLMPIGNWFIKYRIPVFYFDRVSSWSCIANSIGGGLIFWAYLKVFSLPTTLVHLGAVTTAGCLGVALFHAQHSYNPGYVVKEGWNMKDSAIKGSSLIQVPSLLKPFTMGIEYHHIHHYSTGIPGYKMKQCYEEAPPGLWKGITILGYRDFLRSLTYTLFDEDAGKFVTFAEVT